MIKTEATRKTLLTKSYMWLVSCAGAIVFFHSAYNLPTERLDARFLLIAVIMVALSSLVAIRIPRINAQITVSDAFIFMTMLIFGGEAAVLIAALEGVSSAGRLSRKASTLLFNSAATALATFFTVVVLRWSFGNISDLPHSTSLTFVTALCLMALAQYVASSGLVAVLHSFKINQSVWHTWSKYWLWSSITYFAGALTAGVSAKLIEVIGFYLVIAMAPVIAAVYFTYRTYATNVEVSGQQAEQAERHVVELSHHIAEQERIRKALQESEEHFRSSFDYAAIGMSLLAPDGRWLRVNSSLIEIIGYSGEELLATNLQAIVHPDDISPNLAAMQQLLDGTKRFYQMEQRYCHKLGQVAWVLVNASLVRDAKGDPLHFILQIQDISERRAAEEALARSEDQLRQSQKMEAVGQLAGGVAHDFNNLMTAITGYSALMLDDLEEDSALRPDIEEIKRAAERAASLTKQLLAFSRKQMLQPKVLDLNTVITDMQKMLARLIGEDIHIISDLDPELACVEADPSQVEQVIMNLVVNARDSMPNGGRLTIETRNLELDDAYRIRRHVTLAPGPYVMLAVSDTGCGIDAGMQARIFEPFFTTKELGKGTGLGLSTVHGIVVQSGGDIHVRSEIGRGTTFDIYLPQVEDVAEVVKTKVDETTLSKGTQTILLVEDEETVRRLAARILERQGFHLLQAPDGIEALRVAEDYQGVIDLMLTDVVMPEMRGPELAEQIAITRPQMPVLFMSGYNETGLAEQAGVNFIQKPFTPQSLLRQIHGVLEALKEVSIDSDKPHAQGDSKITRGRW
ncbi:MAG: PAS domain S-box protein [Pyrinomonadaceae bacterium]|nr:PAS domain S-box protein [Pyrinomonadaceae bacterium]